MDGLEIKDFSMPKEVRRPKGVTVDGSDGLSLTKVATFHSDATVERLAMIGVSLWR